MTQNTPTTGTTQTDLADELMQVCRLLTDHLTGYAISATAFDEDAFIACERAERLLFDARPGRR